MRNNYFLILLLFAIGILNAQTYQTLNIDGFNQDVIANGIGTAATSTTSDVDGVSYAFKSIDWMLTSESSPQTVGFPVNGIINSEATPGVMYQLKDYSTSNSIQLKSSNPSIISNVSGSVKAKKLFVLVTSGSGISSLTCKITFEDNTKEVFSDIAISDWYSGTSPAIAFRNFGRVGRMNNIVENSSSNPRLYEASLSISVGNENKAIKNIEFLRESSSGGVLNIFAVSAHKYINCPNPLAVTISDISGTTAKVNLTLPSVLPSSGYDYEVRTSGAPGSGAIGLVSSGAISFDSTTFKLTGLPPLRKLYFYIHSNCGATGVQDWMETISFVTNCETPKLIYTTSDNTCKNSAATLSAHYDSGTIRWFDSSTSDTLLAVGNSFVTPNLSSSKSYWVEAMATEFLNSSGGKKDLHGLSNDVNTFDNWGIVFDLNQDVLLKSTDIFVGNYGTLNIAIKDNLGNELFSTGDISVNTSDIDKRATIPLNFKLTAGTGYRMVIKSFSGIKLFRDSSVSFPYKDDNDVLTVTSGFFDGFTKDYYYYFYNVAFEKECFSPRTEVIAKVVDVDAPIAAATQSFCASSNPTLNSIDIQGNGIQWYTAKNGGVALPHTESLEDDTTYYASQTIGTCTSETRTAVKIQLENPTLNVAGLLSTFEYGTNTQSKIAEIDSLTGNYPLTWFLNQTGGNSVATPDVAMLDVGLHTYWVSGTVNGCESERIRIRLNITKALLTVTADPNQSKVCGDADPLLTYTVLGLKNNEQASDILTGSLRRYAGENVGMYSIRIGTLSAGINYDIAFVEADFEITTATLPVTADPQAFCIAENATVGDLVATGADIKWYDDTTGGIALDLTAVLTSKSYFVSQTISNCESARTEVIVTITPNPNAPMATPQIFCISENKTIADLVATGTNLKWYDVATGGTALDSTTVLTSGTYYASQTLNGCESVIRAPAIVTISNIVVTPDQTDVLCHGASTGKASVIVSGGVIPYRYSWDNGIISTTNEATDLSAGTYTVTVTDANGCTTTETFTIKEPTALSITPSQTDVLCHGASTGKASVVVSGGIAPYRYSWDNDITSTTNEATDLSAGTYKVTVADANGCTITETFTVTEPTALSITPNQTDVLCHGSSTGKASVVVSGGVIPYRYSWDNGTTTSSIDNLKSGVYTVTITDANGCSQTQKITITEPALVSAPSSSQPAQNFCKDENKALVNLNITGTNIQWYDSAIGGTALSLNTLLTSKIYYASQTVNGCESPSRKAITVNIYDALPLTSNSVTVCYNSLIQEVSIDGRPSEELKWYMNSSDTRALNPTQLLASGTYYVSTFVHNLCESPRRAVQVTVLAAVPLPGTSQQVVCGSGTVADLTAQSISGAVLKWYSTAQSTTPLAPTTNLLNGTYYVEQEVNGCRSGRKAVAVRVVSLPAPSMTNFVLCEGATVDNLQMAPTSVNYVWFTDATTSIMLPRHHTLTTGYYYVAYESLGCISKRTRVHVKINTRPAAPTGAVRQHFTTKSMVSNIKVNESNVVWYASYEDAVSGTSPFSNQHPLEDQTTYYGVLISKEGCTSYPLAVQVTVTLGLNDFDLASLKYYPNPVTSELTVTYKDVIEQLDVYDLTGKWVKTQTYTSSLVKMNLYDLALGTYMVRIKTNEGEQFIKIVKK